MIPNNHIVKIDLQKNLLFHSDKLLAMRQLVEQGFEGKIEKLASVPNDMFSANREYELIHTNK